MPARDGPAFSGDARMVRVGITGHVSPLALEAA